MVIRIVDRFLGSEHLGYLLAIEYLVYLMAEYLVYLSVEDLVHYFVEHLG